MSKWYATVRDGKEVLSGKGFAFAIGTIFIGVPLLSMFLLVFVYKTQTFESLFGEFKAGGIGLLIGIVVVVLGIVRAYRRVTKQPAADKPQIPTENGVR